MGSAAGLSHGAKKLYSVLQIFGIVTPMGWTRRLSIAIPAIPLVSRKDAPPACLSAGLPR